MLYIPVTCFLNQFVSELFIRLFNSYMDMVWCSSCLSCRTCTFGYTDSIPQQGSCTNN